MKNGYKDLDENTSKADEYVELNPYQTYKKSFSWLWESPRDLWILYISKLVGFSGFYIGIVANSIYVTEILDFSDTEYALYAFSQSFMICVYAVALGWLIDRLGIKISMLVTNGVGILSYTLLITVSSTTIRLIVLIFLFTITWSLNNASVKLGIKKYTSHRSRSIAYSFFTVFMSLCITIASIIVGISFNLGNDEDEDTYFVLFLIAASLMGVGFLQSIFLRELDFNMRGEEELDINIERETKWQAFKAAFSYKSFWRLMGVAFCVALTRTVYVHVLYTLPLYMERDIGEDSQFAYVIGFVNLMCMIFTPFMTVLVYYFDKYTTLVIGGSLCAISPLVLVFGGNYYTILTFAFILALGDSISFPRLIDYTLEIAVPGREGSYFLLSSFPLTVGSLIAGLSSGLLLGEYCPEDGENRCWTVWLVVSSIALVGAASLFFLRQWLEQPIFEPNPYVSWSHEAENNKHN